MLPFNNRLTKRKDFAPVQRRGQFFAHENVMLKMAANGKEESRIGFIVGMAFSKLAVKRNQTKRQLREIIRGRLKEIKKGLDIVITVRKRPDERVDAKKLAADIEIVLKKSGLIKI
ncbi:MAG: ribonuclease P protein component [Candidatus Moranbacteria bacterium]|nr:ribonuclease P protein component [Candidatus Moranbacteria bacterium]